MKLNFWQILGVILLIAGAAWWLYQRSHSATPTNTNNPPATAPAR